MLNFIRSDRSLDHPERLGAYVHSVSINVMMELLARLHAPSADPEEAHQLVDRARECGAERGHAGAQGTGRSVLAELSEKDRRILRAVFLEDADKSRDLQATFR